MEEKAHCGGCSGGGCGGHSHEDTPEKLALHPLAKVGKIYVVVSGKGGVGKSTITALLAAKDVANGKKVGILDADITNPTTHKLFHVPQGVTRDAGGLYPALTESGLQLIGMGFLTEDEAGLITTKASVMAGIVRQVFTEVYWQDLDVLYIDLPSTLSDVVEFALGQMPIDGAIVIQTPGELDKAAGLRLGALLELHQVPVVKEIENFGSDLAFDAKIFEAANTGQMENLSLEIEM